MEQIPLSRRGFLRLSVIAAGSALAAACQPGLQEALTETAAAAPTPTPILQTKISLVGADQDVWAWTKSMKVDVSKAGKCEEVAVYVNRNKIEVQPEGKDFTAEVRLLPGENQISATCVQSDGKELKSDPIVYTGRLRQAPTAVIQITLEDGQIVLDGTQSLPLEGGPAVSGYVWSARANNPGPLRLEDGELTGEVSSPSISIVPPDMDGEYYLQLRVEDKAGRQDTSTIYFVMENGKPRIPDYGKENPAWVEGAVVYGIVPFLFGSPAFKAITERLDDLVDLGINALWLAPINVHPADDYGYSVEDYFNLDPAYGTKEAFHQLVEAAHARGIRVLMDFVPNHTSELHPYFLAAQAGGRNSPYWNFYARDGAGNPTHYFDWRMPNLNYGNPEVRRMMIEAFSYWVREFDVDGFRVDAAWAVKERRPDFWPEWRKELKRLKPDLFLLAEASARDPYYFDNGFDAAYDWTDQVGGWAWRIIWDTYKYRLLTYNLRNALTNRPDGFHPDALIFRFLNNNDTAKRFITRHGEGVTRVATALLLTLPGIPCIYTGDEYGLEFEPYQELNPLTFEEKYPGLRDYHKKLIDLRRSLPSLHSRLWIPLIKPDTVTQPVYGYLRYGESADSPVLVLLNFSEEQAELEFELPKEFSALSRRRSLYDLLTEENVPVSGDSTMRLTLPALTARVLVEEPPAAETPVD